MAGYCTHCGGSGFRRPSQERGAATQAERLRIAAGRCAEAGEHGLAAELRAKADKESGQ